ncbi:MAG: hypothetical protein WC119_11555, partial [Synergistaceae bacterium]
RFSHPSDVAVDNSGVVYVADTDNHAVRKIWGAQVLTIAGGTSSANAWNVRASKYIPFCTYPECITVNAKGEIFVASGRGQTMIKKITPKGWIYHFSGLTDGSAGHSIGTAGTTAATSRAYTCSYTDIQYMDVDRYGYLYVVDLDSSTGYSRLVKVDPNGSPSNIVDLHAATTSSAGITGVAVSPAAKVFVSITTPDEIVSSSSSSMGESSSSSSS